MSTGRNYIQARNLKMEAKAKLHDFDSIMGRAKKDYEKLRVAGIRCYGFGEKEVQIQVTRMCWNHVFQHPVKRRSRVEKIERAMCLPMAIKLLKKTRTYQEVSKERDKGGNRYLAFGIIGYVRGNRIKVIIRKQDKVTNPQYVLYSFYQMSQAPVKALSSC